MDEQQLHRYFSLSREEIRQQLQVIVARSWPVPGKRQVPFTPVETLICYGLFHIVDPHKYGGRNIATVPFAVQTIAVFFKRTAGSVLSKMLNLDGSRQHGAYEEPLLFAQLSTYPDVYYDLYATIIDIARNLTIDEQILPDFLHEVVSLAPADDLLGQDDLPSAMTQLLADASEELIDIRIHFNLGEPLTEKLVERKIRLAQHRFAQAVLNNCGRACVFCGFEPWSLPHSGLLRASHIKPWAVSHAQERVDVRNGIVACPIHDAAFDQGYLTIDNHYAVFRSAILEESIQRDNRSDFYFEQMLSRTLLLPQNALKPKILYLLYHQEHIFKKAQ